MKIAHFVRSAVVVGGLALLSSGCFATRMVRTDTITSYDVVEAQATAQAEPNLAAPRMMAADTSGGTLVVEALVVPPPPAGGERPVRLPDSVAGRIAVATPRVALAVGAPAPAWDPLPSYVAQFTGAGWLHRPVFGVASQPSTSFGHWSAYPGRSAMSAPYGSRTPYYGASTGAYGSASPHFSSAPSFSGSLSSHFSGGYPGSGF